MSVSTSTYTRVCASIARLCMYFGVVGLVLLVVAVLYQVIGRYVFNDTPTWAESGAVLLVLRHHAGHGGGRA
jgi:TRAP-type C4-dicarboxylate transport system permease small subunit